MDAKKLRAEAGHVGFLASGRWEVQADKIAAGAVGKKWENKNPTGVFSGPSRGDYKLYSAQPELAKVSSHHGCGD